MPTMAFMNLKAIVVDWNHLITEGLMPIIRAPQLTGLNHPKQMTIEMMIQIAKEMKVPLVSIEMEMIMLWR